MKDDRAVSVLARAFQNETFMRYVEPDDARRRAILPAVFSGCVRYAFRHGGVVNVEGAAATWIDSHVDVKMTSVVQTGLLMLPLRMGLGAFFRMDAQEKWGAHTVAELVQGRYGYLWELGVDADRKGQGLARSTVLAVLAQMRARELPTCILRTEDAHNVPIYEHLGFDVVRQVVSPKSGLPAWFMTRPVPMG